MNIPYLLFIATIFDWPNPRDLAFGKEQGTEAAHQTDRTIYISFFLFFFLNTYFTFHFPHFFLQISQS